MKKKGLISNILNAELEVNNTVKYLFILGAVTVIHLCLAIIFCCFHILSLAVLNAISVVIYLLLEIVAAKGYFEYCFWVTSLEVLINMIVSTVIVGWTAGFVLYILGMLPVSFYMVFTVLELRRRARAILVFCIVSVAAAIGVVFRTGRVGAIYQGGPESLLVGLCIFNFMISYAIVGIFTILFIMEIRSNERILERKNRELDKVAGFDYLTGLYNRRSMEELLRDAEASMSDGEVEYTVILADIDNFKSLNDRFGHECGDDVLKMVCRLMKDITGKKGYVSRWGGEEVLFLCRLDMDEARELAEEVRKAVESSALCYKGKDIRCTVTIGLAPFNREGGAEKVIDLADKNMYRGKSRTKNCVVG